MTSFWWLAAILMSAAVAFLIVPLWRQRHEQGRWSRLGLGAAIATVPLALGLYQGISTWDPQAPSAQPSPMPPVADLVAALAARLQANPEDAEGWRLLGRSYVTLGEYRQAHAALREAWQRTPEPDDDLKLALAEAQALADVGALGGEAGRLLEEVLARQPNHPKALWYGGLAAHELGRDDLARERWTRLLALNPPQPVAGILEAQLARLGGAASTPQLAQAPPGPAAADGVSVRLRVRLGESVRAPDLGPQAALFIFARAAEGGPPVAVIRDVASAVPGVFSLSDRNAMIPGRSLGDFETLTLMARLSAQGQPSAQPGDLYGERQYRPGEDPPEIDLVIDRVAE